jgi:hypothetical protein
MAIMVLSGNKKTTNIDSTTNRGCNYGGSCGGNKKAGIVTYGPSWQRKNMGNFLKRAPQRLRSVKFSLLNTTRNPTQFRRGSYFSTHSGMLG